MSIKLGGRRSDRALLKCVGSELVESARASRDASRLGMRVWVVVAANDYDRDARQ